MIEIPKNGDSPSGKAVGSGPTIRGFESLIPSHISRFASKRSLASGSFGVNSSKFLGTRRFDSRRPTSLFYLAFFTYNCELFRFLKRCINHPMIVNTKSWNGASKCFVRNSLNVKLASFCPICERNDFLCGQLCDATIE